MPTRRIRSACHMCHGVCHVWVHLQGDRVVQITGDRESPASRGYLCSKGAASPELLYHPDRVLYPLRRAGKRGENRWKRIGWGEALDEMAARSPTTNRSPERKPPDTNTIPSLLHRAGYP